MKKLIFLLVLAIVGCSTPWIDPDLVVGPKPNTNLFVGTWNWYSDNKQTSIWTITDNAFEYTDNIGSAPVSGTYVFDSTFVNFDYGYNGYKNVIYTFSYQVIDADHIRMWETGYDMIYTLERR